MFTDTLEPLPPGILVCTIHPSRVPPAWPLPAWGLCSTVWVHPPGLVPAATASPRNMSPVLSDATSHKAANTNPETPKGLGSFLFHYQLVSGWASIFWFPGLAVPTVRSVSTNSCFLLPSLPHPLFFLLSLSKACLWAWLGGSAVILVFWKAEVGGWQVWTRPRKLCKTLDYSCVQRPRVQSTAPQKYIKWKGLVSAHLWPLREH